MLRLGEYVVHNVSGVSLTPRLHVAELGTTNANELPWLRGCRVARQSPHTANVSDVSAILTVCVVRETAADGAQMLVLRAWLLWDWAQPVASGSVTIATAASAAAFDMASFVSVGVSARECWCQQLAGGLRRQHRGP